MVADGDPVPRGGGQYLVGHPYTIAGRTYYPRENSGYSAVGLASWYGDAFHGRRTANGEVYDMRAFTAAHPTMPLPSYARVTNLTNGYSISCALTIAVPSVAGASWTCPRASPTCSISRVAGTGRVKVDYIGPAPLDGSDDEMLLASLRTNGSLATLNAQPQAQPTMVAEAAAHPTPRRSAPPPPAPADDDLPMVAAASPMLMRAPPPPARPFDLGEIARFLDTASAAPAATPRPPLRQAWSGQRALYFATDGTPASRLLRPDPFAQCSSATAADGAAGARAPTAAFPLICLQAGAKTGARRLPRRPEGRPCSFVLRLQSPPRCRSRCRARRTAPRIF